VGDVGMGVCRVDVFDHEQWAKQDGLKPPADAFFALLPCFLAKPFDGATLRAELAAPPPGTRAVQLSAAIVEPIRARLPQHPYKPCTDPTKYARRLSAAKAWVETLSVPAIGPLGNWRGRDVQTPWAIGVCERLVGSFSLAPEDAAALIDSIAPGAKNTLALAKNTAQGTWPADLDGEQLDEEARQVAEANRRSDEARARNAAEAAKIVDVVVGDEGLEGFRCRVGCVPAFAHLQNPRSAIGGGPSYRPPSLVQGGWQYWLRRQIPGETLPEISLPDGSGTIPRDTVLRLTKGQLASAVDGPWADWPAVREIRAQNNAADLRPIAPEEFIGEGDPRCEAVLEHAAALAALYLPSLLNQMTAPHQRVHVVSALVRGLMLRPEVAAACIRKATGVHEYLPAPKVPDVRGGIAETGTGNWDHSDREFVDVKMAGTRGASGIRIEVPAPEPVRDTRLDWLDQAVIGAANGDATWSVMSPGVLLEPLHQTLAERVAGLVKQDPFEPLLRAHVRGKEDQRFSSEDLCKVTGADITKKNETGRIRAVMNRLGFEKREFTEPDGNRFRAYARAS
jgi:hypothetical protein